MHDTSKEPDRVAVLMCTFNGSSYLQQQLDSIAVQTHKNWFLLASDDLSTDTSREILGAYQQKWPAGQIEILQGPGQGFVKNFMFVTHAATGLADYYAWSDQDDIWHADKLERALEWLKSVPADIPALYCGRTNLVTEDNSDIGQSMLFRKRPGFANAIMQNIGGGNTMVFNQAACDLIVRTSMDTELVSHDWWAYIIVAASGGQVKYDPEPCLRYRQHGKNLIGANNSWSARMVRIRALNKGRFKHWNDLNIQALQKNQECLTEVNQQVLEDFASARQKTFFKRLIQLKRSGIYRQTFIDNLGLVFAAILRKL